MLEKLKSIDTQLFLYLNSRHSPFFDGVMYWASSQLFWIPLYLTLALLAIWYIKKQRLIFVLCCAVLNILSDQISTSVLKNNVKRLRPSHQPGLEAKVHLSAAGPGGLYGFVSSHAANSFALVLFLCLILPRSFKWLKLMFFLWAFLVCYSRIYNGVHYPGDIICGAIIGSTLAWLMSKVYFRLCQQYKQKADSKAQVRTLS